MYNNNTHTPHAHTHVHTYTHTQVDMPVFFYIDPEINEDPAMAKVDTIILSYTFFEAKEEESIYLPVPKQTL